MCREERKIKQIKNIIDVHKMRNKESLRLLKNML